ncbi:MAG: hypothetical protein PWR01_599 [Clostridiales bacterium]|nr:hypothetical protein [Clostridiales bacterium]
MDYVGCKVFKRHRQAPFLTAFYMDYVGCKVPLVAESSPAQSCFIWTMWDVKATMVTGKDTFTKVLYGLCGM